MGENIILDHIQDRYVSKFDITKDELTSHCNFLTRRTSYKTIDGDDFKSVKIDSIKGLPEECVKINPQNSGDSPYIHVEVRFDYILFSEYETDVIIRLVGAHDFAKEVRYHISLAKPKLSLNGSTQIKQDNTNPIACFDYGFSKSFQTEEKIQRSFSIETPFLFKIDGKMMNQFTTTITSKNQKDVFVVYDSESVLVGNQELKISVNESDTESTKVLSKQFEIIPTPFADLDVKFVPKEKVFLGGINSCIGTIILKSLGDEITKPICVKSVTVSPEDYFVPIDFNEEIGFGKEQEIELFLKDDVKSVDNEFEFKLSVVVTDCKCNNKSISFTLAGEDVVVSNSDMPVVRVVKKSGINLTVSEFSKRVYEPTDDVLVDLTIEALEDLSNLSLGITNGSEYVDYKPCSKHLSKGEKTIVSLNIKTKDIRCFPVSITVSADYVSSQTVSFEIEKCAKKLEDAPTIIRKIITNKWSKEDLEFCIALFTVTYEDFDSKTIKPREGELLKSADSKVFFKDSDGNRLQSIELNRNRKEYQLFVSNDFGNEEKAIKTDVEYVSCTPENNKTYSVESSIDALKEEPSIKVSYRFIGDSEFVEYNSDKPIELEYKYKKQAIEQAREKELFEIKVENNAIQEYKDFGIAFVPQIREGLFSLHSNEECYVKNGQEPIIFKVFLNCEQYVKDKFPEIVELKLTIKNKVCAEKTKEKDDISLRFKMNFKKEIVDGWYSLDLGTTGIVMAKMENKGEISLLKLKDAEEDQKRNIEQSNDIISSITILKKKDENGKRAQIILSPASKVSKQEADFTFVPAKFMVGQSKIPFFSDFEKNNQTLRLDDIEFAGVKETVDFESSNKIDENIEKYIEYTLKDILEQRMSEDEKIQRLIFTYPGTYVPSQLEKIEKVLSKIKRNTPVTFVPESDAVVAFYINKRINSTKGFEKLNKKEDKQERILIYDMGAGTLDLSFVVLRYENESSDKKIAEIKNRIGLPIGGNYVDYLIYQYIKDYQNSQSVFQLKDSVKNNIKVNLSSEDKKLSDICSSDIKSSCNSKISDLNHYLEEKYIKLCVDEVLENFFGTKEWEGEFDTFVYSGRASQLFPLKMAIKKRFEGKNVVDEDTIQKDELKSAVAIGAINYCNVFEHPGRYGFSINNRNIYQKLGIIYDKRNENGGTSKAYKQLFDPNELDWDNCDLKHGTRVATISKNIDGLDFSHAHEIFLVQTCLPEILLNKKIEENKDENYKCFISQIFELDAEALIDDDQCRDVKIALNCNEDKKIILTFNGTELKERRGTEDIEKNQFYVNSSWPRLNVKQNQND